MLFNITEQIQSLDNNSQTLKLDIKPQHPVLHFLGVAGAHYKLGFSTVIYTNVPVHILRYLW